jgi:carbonic anhydrase/acetyltransferase-like protein (isoleucine patch superfamily)
MEIRFDSSDFVEQVDIDFQDGAGPVPAHQHIRGGGWVAETAKVDDNCYIGPFAMVYGEARVSENVIINDYARVYGNAKIYGRAKVYGDCQVYEEAQVYGDARVSGHSKVYGKVKVMDNAMVYDYSEVYGDAIVRNNAEVLNYAKVYGGADIYDSLKVYANSVVTRKPKACYGFDYNVTITDHHICLGCVVIPPKFIDTTAKKIVRMMGYHPDEAVKWVQALKYVAEFHGCTDREEDIEAYDERKIITDLLNARVGL